MGHPQGREILVELPARQRAQRRLDGAEGGLDLLRAPPQSGVDGAVGERVPQWRARQARRRRVALGPRRNPRYGTAQAARGGAGHPCAPPESVTLAEESEE